MKKQSKFSLQRCLKSFKYAFNGFQLLIREEPNAKVHFFITVCVLAAGFVFRISNGEWMAVILCIGLVITLELLNSAIENIADFVSPEKHEAIKRIKDLAAGAVLVGAITSVVVGMIVFLPKIIEIFTNHF